MFTCRQILFFFVALSVPFFLGACRPRTECTFDADCPSDALCEDDECGCGPHTNFDVGDDPACSCESGFADFDDQSAGCEDPEPEYAKCCNCMASSTTPDGQDACLESGTTSSLCQEILNSGQVLSGAPFTSCVTDSCAAACANLECFGGNGGRCVPYP